MPFEDPGMGVYFSASGRRKLLLVNRVHQTLLGQSGADRFLRPIFLAGVRRSVITPFSHIYGKSISRCDK